MTEELENAEVVEEIETTEVEGEVAPADSPEGEKIEGLYDQEKANAAFAKKNRAYQEAKREAEQAKREADELKAKLAELNKPGPVEVPAIPDPYDDDYEAKVKARDAAILRNAEFEAQRIASEQRKQEELRTAEAEQQRMIQKQAEQYMVRATESGLTKDDVEKSGRIIIDAGPQPELVNFLLDDEQGPEISKYLASNPLLLDEIVGMSPISAVLKIEREVRSQVKALKPKASNAPDPAETLTGRGAPEKDYEDAQGAKFF